MIKFIPVTFRWMHLYQFYFSIHILVSKSSYFFSSIFWGAFFIYFLYLLHFVFFPCCHFWYTFWFPSFVFYGQSFKMFSHYCSSSTHNENKFPQTCLKDFALYSEIKNEKKKKKKCWEIFFLKVARLTSVMKKTNTHWKCLESNCFKALFVKVGT